MILPVWPRQRDFRYLSVACFAAAGACEMAVYDVTQLQAYAAPAGAALLVGAFLQ